MNSLQCFAAALVITCAVAVFGSQICQSKPPADCSCPTQWQLWQGGCYRLTPSKQYWDDAKETCQDLGGQMAAPRSLEEMSMMAELARSETWRFYSAWIACNDREVKGTWECDGQEGDEPFLVWNEGQPDNLGNYQDCATISSIHDDKMDDDTCSGFVQSTHQAICVRHAACTPAPTPPRRYCVSTDAHGRVLSSTCLLHHSIRELATEGVVACGSACAQEPRCRSFNIKKDGDGGNMICQLNNSTSSEDKDQFQTTEYFCMYSEVCFD